MADPAPGTVNLPPRVLPPLAGLVYDFQPMIGRRARRSLFLVAVAARLAAAGGAPIGVPIEVSRWKAASAGLGLTGAGR
jgi:hypothetical protein